MSTTIRLVLGDQLDAGHVWFREPDDQVVVVMMEVRSETDTAHHHAQKVLALFASMRAFADALAAAGHVVRYWRIGDADNAQTFEGNLATAMRETGASRLERQHGDEWRVERLLEAAVGRLGLATTVVEAEHFFADRDEWVARFTDRIPRMEVFYREMRRRVGVLLDAAGAPEGGRWNFDAENRARWPGQPQERAWPWPAHDVSALWAEIQASGIKTMGSPSEHALPWPLSRREARAGLAHFIEHALPNFGRYEDALPNQADWLFHSILSFAMNSKMLRPAEVVDAAVAAWRTGAVPLASVEGFVRQILGWREFMRIVYWTRMPGFASENALGATRALPRWYWDADTRMRCCAHAVSQSLERAYAHHIQRLMITGAFALLSGVHPDEVDAWYLGIYIDAFEWVEITNTRGMSQFADGGVIGSKPYCSSAAYIHKQGDHCESCHYDRRLRHGERACPFNSLYWHFHERHRALLGSNPRLNMPYRLWDRLDPDERRATLAQAEIYLAQLDEL